MAKSRTSKTPIRLNIVIDEDERRRFAEALAIERKRRRSRTLSDWVRRVLNRAADDLIDDFRQAS